MSLYERIFGKPRAPEPKLLGPTNLTPKQRRAILERDNHTPQLRHYSEEKGWHKGGLCSDGEQGKCDHLHVHHIKPQGVMKDANASRDDINDPYNLITTGACEHTGVCPSKKIGT